MLSFLMTQYPPMRLRRIPAPFDHPDFLYEVKHDGFRALAYVERRECQLVSRNGRRIQGVAAADKRNREYRALRLRGTRR